MHTVIIDGDVSYPPTSGKRLRTLHLMLRLAKRHQLTYIGRCDGSLPSSGQARAYLEDHGIETILVDHPVPRKAGPRFLARLAGNVLFSDLPYSVASHDSADAPGGGAICCHACRGCVAVRVAAVPADLAADVGPARRHCS